MILLYLRIALFFGFVNYVYELANRWGGNSNNTRRYNAAAEVQKELQKHGFHECPYCYWSTRTRYEHLERSNSWCSAEAERSLNRQFDSMVGDQYDPYMDPNSFEGMPDRYMH